MKFLKQLMMNRIRLYLAKRPDASPMEVWNNEFRLQSSLKMVAKLMGEVRLNFKEVRLSAK